jgi:hypothetical protein
MMRYSPGIIIVSLALITSIGIISTVPQVFATTWYPGQGLKQGDFYRYNVCWTDWHNCAPLEIDFWVKNQTSDGTGWNLEMVATDGSIVQKGIVSIGTVTPDPTYSDPNISDYAGVYKNTIAWLDAFSSKDNAQTLGSPSWGRTGSVGGQSVSTMGTGSITVTAGTFQTWILGWHKGVDNRIWIDPTLSFPVKAIVYTDVTSGVPPPDYTLELLQQGNNPTEPSFLNVQSSLIVGSNANCPAPDMVNDAVSNSQTTDSNSMVIAYRYSPSNPHIGCRMEWRISFEKIFDQTQKYNSVQYDIFTVDNSGRQLDSIAQDNGRTALFAPVGDDDRIFILKGTTPVSNFVLAALGTGAEGSTPDASLAGLVNVTVSTQPSFGGTTNTPQPIKIPSWIKNTAGWWKSGQVGDSDFIKGLQYMIQNGIIQIPPSQGSSSGSQVIPAWVKNDAGYWSSNQIDDSTFVGAIQYLITNGIIQIHS